MTDEPLTAEQRQILAHADKSGSISDADRKKLPGFHFCPDWDEMAICKGTPEWDACTCDFRRDA